MGRRAAETIVHGIVAAFVVMVLLRVQRIHSPQDRIRFWLLAMGLPLAGTPLLWVLAPWRLDEGFRDGWALVSGSHLGANTGHVLGPLGALMALLVLAGTALFLRDAIPFVLEFITSRPAHQTSATPSKVLSAAADRAAVALGMETPRLSVLVSKHPILMCRGLRKPFIVVSTGLCEMLSPGELRASIAHEMSHAKHRDPVLGWALLVARGLCFFNPAVQLAARAAVLEIERRADQSAARMVGSTRDVVDSLRKISGAHGVSGHTAGGAKRMWQGFRMAAIEMRCQTLLRHEEASSANLPPWILPTTAIGLGVILFLTVA